jgi:hypothetical protein
MKTDRIPRPIRQDGDPRSYTNTGMRLVPDAAPHGPLAAVNLSGDIRNITRPAGL